ncbi:hypothetical protein [Thalassovita aquimarina]|uniref:hypothetical protein n=1 Tax=Thalassovita aquimarina TaxID=2785917 RepID=UPI00356A37A1
MTPFRLAWWGLTLLVAALFAAMLVLGRQHLFAGPEALPPFDARVAGYTLEEARAYLVELTADQMAFYAGPMRWMDTAFPLLLGLWGWVSLRGLGSRFALIAPVYTVADLFENALVGQMLKQGAEGLSPGYVDWASTATIVKFALLALALIALGHVGLRRWGRL